MPSVYPTDMLTGGILTWFGMFGAENASRYALQCICDLSMCCCCNYSFWLCFRGYAAMFDAWLFIFVWQVVSWHDLACLVHRMLLMVHCKHLWFEHLMLLSLAFDFASGGILPCLMPVYWYMFARWCPDMIWHVSSSTCLCFAFANTCARCYTEGRAGHNKSTQKSRKQVWGVSSWFFVTSWENSTSNSPWQPPPDNHHPTCHGGDHSK